MFLYEEIFMCYGLPIELVNDRKIYFLNDVIAGLLDEFMVIHIVSAPYHPQENGQTKLCVQSLPNLLLPQGQIGKCFYNQLSGLTTSSIQIFNWHHAIQSFLWHECCTAHGFFDTYSTSSYKP